MVETRIKVATERRQKRERDAEAAAQTIFVRSGYSGARVDEIAKEAGYNKALIFHYFQDKLGLYQEVVGRMKSRNFAMLKERISALVSDEAEPITREWVRTFLEQSVRLTFDHYREHAEIRRLLAWESAERWLTFSGCNPVPPDETWVSKVRAFLRRAQEAGIIRPEIDANMLMANISGMGLIFLTSIPRYQHVFPGVDFASPEAQDHAREQMALLVVNGAMTPDPDAAS